MGGSAPPASNFPRLGPRDRRLQVRRCLQCRIAHRRCDEGRPCSACRLRKVACEDGRRHAPRSGGGEIVFKNTTISPPRTIQATDGTSTSQPDRFSNSREPHLVAIDAFYEFIGHEEHLPLALQTLARSSISRVTQDHQHVYFAALAVGAAYRLQGDTSQSDSQVEALRLMAANSYYSAQQHLETIGDRGSASTQLSDVICAVLLHIYQLIEDTSNRHLINVTERIFQPLFIQYCRGPHFDGVDVSSFRVFWLFELLYAEIFDQGTFLADKEWPERLGFPSGQFDALVSFSNPLDNRFDRMQDFLMVLTARTIRLSAQCSSWRNLNRDGTVYPPLRTDAVASGSTTEPSPQSPSEDEADAQRLDLLREGHLLLKNLALLQEPLDEWQQTQQTRIDAPGLVPTFTKESGALSVMNAYQSACKLAIPRLFADPLWTQSRKNPDHRCPQAEQLLPTISPEEANQLALHSLSLIEQRLAPNKYDGVDSRSDPFLVGLEAIIYLPALIIVALEARCATFRSRLASMFEAVKARGLVAITAAVYEDIKLAWLATGSDCGTFCICGGRQGSIGTVS